MPGHQFAKLAGPSALPPAPEGRGHRPFDITRMRSDRASISCRISEISGISAPALGFQQLAVNVAYSADVEAARRLVGEDDRRVRIERTAEYKLCMLPPESRRMRASGDGHFTS